MTTLPKSLASALPSRERRSPSLELQDGRWLAAAKSGLYVFGIQASSGDETPTPRVLPVVRRARARWEAEGELFALEWVDPAHTPLAGRTAGDPVGFHAPDERVRQPLNRHARPDGNGRGDNNHGVVTPGPRRAFLGADGGRSAGR